MRQGQPTGSDRTRGMAHEDRFGSWLSFVCSTNYRDIGTMYLAFAIVAASVSAVAATAFRVELVDLGLRLPGDQHAFRFLNSALDLIIAFFVIIPTLIGAFGSWLVPPMIGASGMAFPRMHSIAFWLLPLSLVLLLMSLFIVASSGAAERVPGWMIHGSPKLAIDCAIVSFGIAGVSSMLSAVNFIVTILNMRAPSMKLHAMPLFVWSILVTATVLLLWLSVSGAAVAKLYLEAYSAADVISLSPGGVRLVFPQAFWLLDHPEIYILILPSTGIISEVVSTFSKRPVAGHLVMAYAMVAIGFVGFFAWAHRMYVVDPSMDTDSYFALVTIAIVVLAGAMVALWVATLLSGDASFRTPMFWAIGFIFLFVVGSVTGALRPSAGADPTPPDAYRVLAHFHYVLSLGAVFAIFAGWYYWFPKISGLLYNETLGKLHFWITFIGVNLVFFPQHLPSPAGILSRYADYPAAVEAWRRSGVAGWYVIGAGFLVFLLSVTEALIRRQVASHNPWMAKTLEWTTPATPFLRHVARYS